MFSLIYKGLMIQQLTIQSIYQFASVGNGIFRMENVYNKEFN